MKYIYNKYNGLFLWQVPSGKRTLRWSMQVLSGQVPCSLHGSLSRHARFGSHGSNMLQTIFLAEVKQLATTCRWIERTTQHFISRDLSTTCWWIELFCRLSECVTNYFLTVVSACTMNRMCCKWFLFLFCCKAAVRRLTYLMNLTRYKLVLRNKYIAVKLYDESNMV